MIAVDTNVLVHAFNVDSEVHEPAAAAVAELARGRRWGIPSAVAFEFLVVVTSARVERPAAPAVALSALDAWLGSPGCNLLNEPADLLARTRELLDRPRVAGPRIYDARIVATCLAHGVSEVWTIDGDFTLFPELRSWNPLVS